MFIELSEMLRCPSNHEECHLVVATSQMQERSVRQGVVGCPACHAEYVIHDGVVRFGDPAEAPPVELPDPAHLRAFLGVEGPGGFVVAVGSAVAAAPHLATHLDGVHLVGVNGPDGLEESATLSLLTAERRLPFRSRFARGAIVGMEHATAEWLGEAARVTLPGRYVIVLREGVDVPDVEQIVEGHGIWVGRKG